MIIKSLFATMRFIYHHPLNKGRRFAAFARWARWQVGSRLVPGAIAVTFVNDVQILVEPGMTGATGNVYAGLHEFQDMSFVLHSLRPGDLFVDVGANIGSYTLLAGGAAGAECMAIEPISSSFIRLERNVALNGLLPRVTPLNVAIGHEEGKIRFTTGLDTENHALDEKEAETCDTQEVRITTLDNVVGDLKPTLIKIDVEGFETNVINGAQHVLALNALDAVLIELNGLGRRYGFDEEDVHRRMLESGFNPYTYLPFDRSLNPAGGINPVGNTLYIKNVGGVTQRLKTAPRFHVANTNTWI